MRETTTMANPTLTALGEGAQRYRAKPGKPKYGVLCWEPAQYQLEWGSQGFDRPHMVVGHEPDRYGVDLRVFFNTHRPVLDKRDHYVKDTVIRAVQMTQPTDIVTVVDGKTEMRATVPAGAWVIENPAGELYYNENDKFHEQYEPVND